MLLRLMPLARWSPEPTFRKSLDSTPSTSHSHALTTGLKSGLLGQRRQRRWELVERRGGVRGGGQVGVAEEEEMRLWQRLAGALKDKNSVWAAQLSRRTSFRNPNLEVTTIKGTNRDRYRINCKNVQRVFQWVRTSPLYLKPLTWALAMRMQKTFSPPDAFPPSSPASLSLFPL